MQRLILEDPTRGDVVPGSGGIRKLRVADPSRGKGTRGGFRVLYLDLPDRDHTHLIWIYRKGTSENISSDEKEIFRNLVQLIKMEKAK